MSFLKKLFGGTAATEPSEPIFPKETFSIARLNFPEGWGLATFNNAYKDYPNKRHYPWLVHVDLEITSANENGHPTDDEAVRLKNLEERLFEFLRSEQTTHFIARITRPGARELMYYIDKPRMSNEAVKSFCDNVMLERPINFAIEKDPGWNSVSGFIGK